MYISFGIITSKKHHIASSSKRENFQHISPHVIFEHACFDFCTYIIGGGDLQGPKQKVPWLTKEDNCGIKIPLLFAGAVGQPWYNSVILTV